MTHSCCLSVNTCSLCSRYHHFCVTMIRGQLSHINVVSLQTHKHHLIRTLKTSLHPSVCHWEKYISTSKHLIWLSLKWHNKTCPALIKSHLIHIYAGWHQLTCLIITHSPHSYPPPSTVEARLSEICADRRQRAGAGTGYSALYTCTVSAVRGLQ